MDSVLGWFGQLMEWMGRLFPRLLIVPATDIGLVFRRGHKKIPLAPGLHVVWPLWSTWITRPAVRQTEKVGPQLLTTKCGKPLYVRVVARYEIRDAAKALGESYDLDEAIDDETAGVVASLFVTLSVDEVLTGWATVNTRLRREIRKQLFGYGVHLLEAHITDYSVHRHHTLNHVGVFPGAGAVL